MLNRDKFERNLLTAQAVSGIEAAEHDSGSLCGTTGTFDRNKIVQIHKMKTE